MAFLQLDYLPKRLQICEIRELPARQPPLLGRLQSGGASLTASYCQLKFIPGKEEGMEDTIRIQRDTVDEHIRHENSKNWSGVLDTFP
jgi:hypothetical protein